MREIVRLADVRTTVIAPPAWVEPLAGYRRQLAAAGRPASTIKIRLYQLRRAANTLRIPPTEVSHEDLLNYLDRPDWGNDYRRTIRSALRGFFGWARATGLIDTDPAFALPTITPKQGKPRPTGEDALEHALATADERTRLMIVLAAATGARCCEIAVVHSRDLRGRRGDYRLELHGKGNRDRIVPIPEALAWVVRDADGYLFPGQIEGHLSAAYVSKLISRALPGFTAHTLRHRFATRTLRFSGGNLIIVQRLLGHASVATTQIYTDVEDDQLRAAVGWAA
jgi:site-specific recombinase XerD